MSNAAGYNYLFPFPTTLSTLPKQMKFFVLKTASPLNCSTTVKEFPASNLPHVNNLTSSNNCLLTNNLEFTNDLGLRNYIVLPDNLAQPNNAMLSNNLPLSQTFQLPDNLAQPNNVTFPNHLALSNPFPLPSNLGQPNNVMFSNSLVSSKAFPLPDNLEPPNNVMFSNNLALPKTFPLPNNLGQPNNVMFSNNLAVSKAFSLPDNLEPPNNAMLSNNLALPKTFPLPNNLGQPNNVMFSNNLVVPKIFPLQNSFVCPNNDELLNNLALRNNLAFAITPDFMDNLVDTSKLMSDTLTSSSYGNADEDESEDSVEEIFPDFRCQLCSSVIPTYSEYNIHLEEHRIRNSNDSHNMNYPPENQKLPIKSIDKDIKNNVHDDKKFLCFYCLRRFNCSLSLSYHMKEHLKRDSISCVLCKNSFAGISSLRKHLLMCHGQNRNRKNCSFCNYRCFQSSDLEKHVARRHTRDFRYKCGSCIKGFATPKELCNHIKRKHFYKMFVSDKVTSS